MKNIALLMHFSYQHTRVMWQVMSVELSVQIVHISHRSGLIHARTISCACRWEHSWLMKLAWLFVDCVSETAVTGCSMRHTTHPASRRVYFSKTACFRMLWLMWCQDWVFQLTESSSTLQPSLRASPSRIRTPHCQDQLLLDSPRPSLTNR